MPPKKNKKKSNGKARADEISADFGYDESEPDVGIKDEETAADLKVRGNECVKSGAHAVAIKLFTVAIERSPPKEELHLYHSNRSVCALSLKRFPMAIADAEQCVALKPDWSKGYSRLGAAHFYAGNLKESVKAYASGLALDPTNATITEGLAAAQAALAAKAEKPEATEAKEAKEKAVGKGPVVGIDLGTTYSCVAVCAPGQGRVEIIANSDGSRTTPSWVSWSPKEGTRLVGQAAKNQAAANPANTVNDAKRLIGRGFHDAGLQKDLQQLGYRVEEEEGRPRIRVECEAWEGARQYLPEQISAMVLEQLKKDAEDFLGEEVPRGLLRLRLRVRVSPG